MQIIEEEEEKRLNNDKSTHPKAFSASNKQRCISGEYVLEVDRYVFSLFWEQFLGQ